MIALSQPHATLPALVAAADDAYRLVRIEVIDTLPPGAPIDVAALTGQQRQALESLDQAETALASYRDTAYATG